MNKILVVSFYSKHTQNNEFVSLSKEINSAYCKLNNYDFIFDDFEYDRNKYLDKFYFSENDETYNKDMDLHVFLYRKFELIEKYLNKYNYVLFIDCDVCFINPNKTIEDLILDDFNFYFIKHSLIVGYTIWINQIKNLTDQYLKIKGEQYITDYIDFNNCVFKSCNDYDILNNLAAMTCNPYSLNGGFILMKNSDLSFDFIKDVKLYHPLFYKKSCDEGTMGMILQKKKYNNSFKILQNELMGNYNLKYQPEFYYNEDKNFIMHNYGAPMNVKIEGFKQVKQNKWWKQFMFRL